MVESDKVNAATSAAVSCVWSAIHLPMRLVSAYHLRSGGCPKSSEQLDRFQNEAARLYGIMATVYGRFVAAFSPELSRQIENAVLCVQGSYDPPRYFNQVGATWHEAVLKGTHAVLCLPRLQADVFDHRFDCLDDRIRERDFSGLEAALKAVDGEDRSAFWRRVVDEARPTVTEMGGPDFIEAKLKWEAARALAGADTPAPAGVVFRGDGLYEDAGGSVRLDGQEAMVMQALVELRAATKDQLADKSGVTDAVAVLKRIREKCPMLEAAITLPGGKNRGGYRTIVRPV